MQSNVVKIFCFIAPIRAALKCSLRWLVALSSIALQVDQAYSQSGVFNQGVTISIRENTTMSIMGDYTNSGSSADATLFIAGTLRVSGNIYNNSTNASNRLINHFGEDKPFVGRVVMTGLNPTIGGSQFSFFPNLELDRTGSVLTLARNIGIGNSLYMTSGRIDLNGRNVVLWNNASVNSETEVNRIYGAAGAVAVVDSAGSAAFTINTGVSVSNFRNIGLGFQNASNLTDVSIARRHGVNVPYDYALADGVRVLRTYELNTSTEVGQMDLTVRYFQAELNGLDESTLALYISNDNGLHWRRCLNTTIDQVTNTITAPAVPFTNTSTNIVAISVANCLSQRPSVAIDSAGVAIGASLNICEGRNLNLSIPSTYRMQWNIQSTPSVITTNSVSVPNVSRLANTGVYTVWAANERGCENNNNVTVNVRSNPVNSFTVSPPLTQPICHGTQVTFNDASSTEDSSPITQWAYVTDDDVTPLLTTQNPTITYASPGAKSPTLVVTTQYGCYSPAYSLPDLGLAIQSLPVAAFQVDPGGPPSAEVCEDIEIQTSNGSTYTPIPEPHGYDANLLFTWNFGDGSAPVATNNNPYDAIPLETAHIFTEHGAYTITLRTTVENTGCFSESQYNITVNPEPVPNFEVLENGLPVDDSCPGIYLTFQNNTTIPDGTGITYSWDFKDGTASTQLSPVKQYLQHQSYDVELTATSTEHGCVQNIIKNLVINPPPEGTFTIQDVDICPGENAQFNNGSTVDEGTLSYVWDFDDGSTDDLEDPIVTHSYQQPRQYNVKLTRTTNHGCTNTISRTLRVRPAPVAQFISENVCDGESIHFTNLSSIQSGQMVSHLWDFDDATATAVTRNADHLFSHAGDFDVSLTVTSDYGCIGTSVQTVTVYQNPFFDLGTHQVVCNDEFLIDPAASPQAMDYFIPSNSVFEWRDQDGNVLGNTMTLNVQETGVYELIITTSPTDGSCTNTIDVPVFLFTPVNLGADRIVCENELLDAGPSNATVSYEWNFNGPVSTGRTWIAGQTGMYSATVTHTVAGRSCDSSDDVFITIDDPIELVLPAETYECENSIAQILSPVIADQYEWYRIEGQTRTLIGNENDLETSQEGIYALRVSNEACSAETFTQLIYTPLPAISFGVSDLSICPGQNIVISDLSSTQDLTMSTWNFGDGTSSAAYSPVVNKEYTTPGNYVISLSGEDEFQCSFTAEVEVVVNPLPQINFTLSDACQHATIQSENLSTGGLTYAWDFGDGTVSDDFLPTKTFEQSGDFLVTLTVSSSECSATQSQYVTIRPTPSIELGDEVRTCGASIELDAGNSGATYRWFDPVTEATISTSQTLVVNSDRQLGIEVTNSFGCVDSDEASITLGVPLEISLGNDRQVCDEELLDPGYFPGAAFVWTIVETNENFSTPSIIAVSSGTYNIAVVDQNGCVGNASVVLEINTTPLIPLADDYVRCEGQTLDLVAGEDPSFQYVWSTGDTTPDLSVVSSQTLNVTVTNQNCIAQKSIDIVFNSSPFVDFDVANICQNETAVFQNQSYIDQGNLTFLWNFGDGSGSVSQDPAKNFNSAGDFEISLRATSALGCEVAVTKLITVKALPTASFRILGSCSGQDLVPANNSSAPSGGTLAYQWVYGNGDSSTQETPSINFQNAGTYLVTLTVTSEEGCTDSEIKNIDIFSSPSLASWIEDITTCSDAITLSAGNAGSTYLWSNMSTTQDVTINTSGVYSVEITGANGCSIVATTDVVFDNVLQSQLPDQLEACGTVLLDPQVDAATYFWSTGERTPSITASADGEYLLQVITENSCIGRDTVSVDIHPIPVIDLGEAKHACAGDVISLNAYSPIADNYQWSTGETMQSIEVATSGTYSVTVTSPNGCQATDGVAVSVHELPVINFPDQLVACGAVTLDAGNPGSVYDWSNGATLRDLVVSESGVYSVRVTNQNQCSQVDQVTVTVNPLPVVQLGVDIVLCPGEVSILDAGSSGTNYLWSNGSLNRTLQVGSSGVYKVIVGNSFGCTTTDSVNVSVRPPLGLELGPDKLLCSNEGIFLTAGVEAISYEWTSPAGFKASSKEIRPASPGQYFIRVTDRFNCSAVDSIKIIPTTESITASFLIPSTVGRGDIVNFAMLTEPEPVSTIWFFGDGGHSVARNPTYRYYTPGEYLPMLIVSNGVCSDTLTKSIIVREARFEAQPGDSKNLPELIDFVSAEAYPNPCKDIVNVVLSLTTTADVRIVMYRMNGVLVHQQSHRCKEKQIQFDMATEADGVYLIKVMAADKAKLLKIVKMGGN